MATVTIGPEVTPPPRGAPKPGDLAVGPSSTEPWGQGRRPDAISSWRAGMVGMVIGCIAVEAVVEALLMDGWQLPESAS